MIKEFFRAFRYAFFGFIFCLRNERNFRIHLVAFFYVIIFAFLYKMPEEKFILLLIFLTLVLASEMLNTAIEELVNIVKPGYDHLARVAKDVAAGAVLVCSLSAAAAALVLFRDIKKWLEILKFFTGNPLLLVLLVLSILLSLIFIFIGPRETRAVLHNLKKQTGAGKK